MLEGRSESERGDLIRASEGLQRDAWYLLSTKVSPEVRARFDIRAELKGTELYQAARSIQGAGLNKIYSFGLDEPVTEQRLDAARRWIKDRCAGGARLIVPLVDDASDADALFARRGLVRDVADLEILCLDRGAAPTSTRPSSVDARPVAVADAHLFGTVISESLGVAPDVALVYAPLVGSPGFSAYLAYDGETPIGGAAMFQKGDQAFLYLAATIPRFRNRGAQTALLARRLANGRVAGVRTFHVGARFPVPGRLDLFASYRNIRRVGFEPAYLRRVYVPAT